MEIFKKILVVVVPLIILWAVFSSLVIGMSKKGIIVDSVTKKPTEGIHLVRKTNLYAHRLYGGSELTVRSDVTTTDSSGKFYFSPFIKFKNPFHESYRELLYINDPEGYYKNNNSVYFGDIYGVGFSNGILLLKPLQPYSTFKPFNNYVDISLAPVVSALGECKNDEECLQKNRKYARSCLMWSIRTESFTCKNFSLRGTMIFKNDKLFGEDISNDFAECNKEPDDISSALCFQKGTTSNAVDTVVSEATCSTLTYESARNLCYYTIAVSSASKPLCDKITKKPIADGLPFLRGNGYDGVGDYNTLCIKERTRKYGQ